MSPRWLSRRSGGAAHALYCVPPAGGSPGFFAGWAEALGPSFDVHVADLFDAGPPGTTIQDIAAALVDGPAAAGAPYALYGHSMGALVVFELAAVLRAARSRPPGVIVVAACASPDLPRAVASADDLPGYLRLLGGLPSAVAIDDEARAWAMEQVGAHLHICARYSYRPRPPLTSALCVFGGQQDPTVTLDDLNAWHRHAGGAFSVDLLPGGHFFPKEAGALFFERLGDRLHSPRE